MTNAGVLSINPSLTEDLPVKLQVSSPTKRSVVVPLDIARISTPEVSPVKKTPRSDNVTSILQTSPRKGSKTYSATSPAESDGEISTVRHKKEASTGDSMKSPRLRISSISSDPGQRTNKSILKKSQYANDRKTGRRDAAGVLIKKGGKSHKINFKDDLLQVKVVENWKQYNVTDMPHQHCCNGF